MKNYNLHDYRHFVDLQKDMCNDLNEVFKDLEITSSQYTDCEILEIVKPTDFNGKPDFIIEISVFGGIKQFCMRPLFNNTVFNFTEDQIALFNYCIEKLDIAKTEFDTELEEERKKSAIRYAAEQQEREARLKRLAEKREAIEAEEKLQKKIKKSQEDFEKKITAWVKVDKDPIDWLKENVVSVTATIPNHLEKIFVKEFGDVPHKVVDSSRKTSGGYSMKFAPSFMLTVKKDTQIHPALEHLFKDNKLRDTSFIAKLVRDGELSFGKNE